MKNMKKVFSLVLALVMMMALTVAAGASTYTPPSTGTTVDATITIDNASKGVTYYAFKLFDATVDGGKDDATPATGASIAYHYGTAKTVDEIDNDAVKALFKTDANHDGVFTMNDIGQISVAAGVKENQVTAAVAQWAKDQTATDVTPKGVGDGGALTISLGKNYGYYAVISNQSEAAVTVDSTNPTVNIKDKTTVDVPTTPTDAKKIAVINNGTTTYVEAGSYDLGATVHYRVVVPTTNWVRQEVEGKLVDTFIYQYVLTDTPSGLKIVDSTVSVKVKGPATDAQETDLVAGHQATKSVDPTTGVMTITIPWGEEDTASNTQTSYYDNKTSIIVEYDAIVTSATETENSLKAQYNTTDMSGESKTNSYSTQISVDKYAEGNTSRKLAGATFVLMKGDSYYKYTPAAGDNSAKVEWTTQAEATSYTTNAEGKLTIKETGVEANFIGLAAGEYKLVETEAPEGYNKLANPITVKIVEDKDSSGKVTGVHVADATDQAIANGVVGVANSTGTELPSTGGIGTTIFTVTGGLLMIGAAILFLTKKRSEV